MTSPQSAKRAALVAGMGALAILVGCGGERASSEQLGAGKQLFTQKCGSCHVLQDANSKGTTGPNLDAAFGPARQQGFKSDDIEDVVLGQIKLAYPPMPRDLVTGQDATDVASYIATVAGLPKSELAKLNIQGPQGATQKPLAKASAQNVLAIPADPNGQLLYLFKNAQAKAGEVTVNSKNAATVAHDIAVMGNGVNVKGPIVANGKTSSLKVKLRPGKYTFECTVPGHAAAGMKGTLMVQ